MPAASPAAKHGPFKATAQACLSVCCRSQFRCALLSPLLMEKAMATKRCKACGRNFTPWPQTKNQQYCSDTACQRERRRRKQAEKRAGSPAVRASNAQYFKDWSAKNPGYWKDYRARNPEYAERNRRQQRERNLARIAKDAVSRPQALASGLYRLTPASGNTIANEDAWMVEITVLSGPAGN